MEEIYFKKTKELKSNLNLLKEKLKVKITLAGKKAIIEGNSFEEYEAQQVLDAINFGFSAKKALLLKNEEFIFKMIHIKDITKRKNLREIKSRIIGTEGKTKRTIENISECFIEVIDNEVGVIVPAEKFEDAITGIKNLIKGSKQSNVYHYLEKMNKNHRGII